MRVVVVIAARGELSARFWSGRCHALASSLRRRAAAQNVVEYGILLATIAIIVLIGTMAFGNQIEPWFQQLAGRITTTGT
jgi:Flp pilus assembly pilin Flp